VLSHLKDYRAAIVSYNEAIELEPTLAEAYYNRGFVYLKLGNKDAGIADLSKAGELGIIPSYNLLKRMTK
jgi:tetratricopeptide (TPR) repeat protein